MSNVSRLSSLNSSMGFLSAGDEKLLLGSHKEVLRRSTTRGEDCADKHENGNRQNCQALGYGRVVIQHLAEVFWFWKVVYMLVHEDRSCFEHIFEAMVLLSWIACPPFQQPS